MRRPLVIYDFATAPLWIPLIMRKIWFSFLSVCFISLQICLFQLCTKLAGPDQQIQKQFNIFHGHLGILLFSFRKLSRHSDAFPAVPVGWFQLPVVFCQYLRHFFVHNLKEKTRCLKCSCIETPWLVFSFFCKMSPANGRFLLVSPSLH